MPKRTFWLATGVVVGAGSSLWAERKLRRSVQQAAAKLQPDAIVVEVGRSARQVADTAGSRVRDAVTLGRDEMFRREEELWADLASQGVEHMPPGPSAATAPTLASRVAPVPHDERGTRRRMRRPRVKSPSHLDK